MKYAILSRPIPLKSGLDYATNFVVLSCLFRLTSQKVLVDIPLKKRLISSK